MHLPLSESARLVAPWRTQLSPVSQVEHASGRRMRSDRCRLLAVRRVLSRETTVRTVRRCLLKDLTRGHWPGSPPLTHCMLAANSSRLDFTAWHSHNTSKTSTAIARAAVGKFKTMGVLRAPAKHNHQFRPTPSQTPKEPSDCWRFDAKFTIGLIVSNPLLAPVWVEDSLSLPDKL